MSFTRTALLLLSLLSQRHETVAAQSLSSFPISAFSGSSNPSTCVGGCTTTSLTSVLKFPTPVEVNKIINATLTVDSYVTVFEDGRVETTNSTRSFSNPERTITWTVEGFNSTLTWPTQYLYVDFGWQTVTVAAPQANQTTTRNNPCSTSFADLVLVVPISTDEEIEDADKEAAKQSADAQIAQIPGVVALLNGGFTQFCIAKTSTAFSITATQVTHSPISHISVKLITELGNTFRVEPPVGASPKIAPLNLDVPSQGGPVPNPLIVPSGPAAAVQSNQPAATNPPSGQPSNPAQPGAAAAVPPGPVPSASTPQEANPPPGPVVIDGATLSPVAGGSGVVFSGNTVPAGGRLTVPGGPVVSVAPGGSILVVNPVGQAPASGAGAGSGPGAGASVAINGQTIVAGANGVVVVDGNTVVPGAVVTLSGGTPISVGGDGGVVVVPGAAAAPGASAVVATPVTVGGVLVTPATSGSAVVVNGQTVSSGSVVTLADGQALSVGSDGVVMVGGKSFTLPGASQSLVPSGSPGVTASADVLTMSKPKSSSSSSQRVGDEIASGISVTSKAIAPGSFRVGGLEEILTQAFLSVFVLGFGATFFL